jgi:hypothetical protein
VEESLFVKEITMKKERNGLLMACVLLVMASQVGLAQPVQWPANGHWYEVAVVPYPIAWPDARDEAVARGGYLATLTSEAENLFVFDLTAATPGAWIQDGDKYQMNGPWLGGYQDRTAGNYIEPSGGWKWVTGEPWEYTSWLPGQPDNDDWNNYGEDYLVFWGYWAQGPTPTWNDARGPAPDPEKYPQLVPGFVVEYDPAPVAATIDVKPDTLNLKSAGKWITCHIELADDYDVGEIAISTVQLNGQVSAEPQPTQVGDYDADGAADLMVKFDRAAVQEILEVGDAVLITVTGQLEGGESFLGTDAIRVISPGGGRK